MKLELIEGGPTKNFEKSLDLEMDPLVKHFEKELLKVRTGRAQPSLVEGLKVNCYNTTMALKEVAGISAPEAQLIVIQPWDPAVLSDIEKAILISDLGLTPLNDGNIIRIQLPKMSSERREELIKTLHKKGEECRISLRNIRKEAQAIMRDAEKGKKLSEDYIRRLQDSLQKITDKYIEIVDKIIHKKEDEVRQL